MTEAAPDLELLDQWCAGDSEAGSALFARHFDSIARFFDRKVQRDADELVQATFLACVKSRDSFRKQCSFRTYLFTLARNVLYRHLRGLRHERNLDFHVTSLAELCTTPATRIGRDREKGRLLEALTTLPLEQQLMIELHYWEGMAITELADIFDMPAETARTKLFRARRTLRDTIAA